jgi:2-(1,2-epoxy-1,2-dihydrophenyl)acetyl-CoA isomerase
MTEPVELTVVDGVAHLELTRPAAGNAIGLATARALREAARGCVQSSVRVVLLTARGRNFCVGGDLREFAAIEPDGLAEHLIAVTDALHEAQLILAGLDAPTVAAVHGAVAGAGMGLALGCDLIVAADNATFVAAYTGIGFTPDAGTSWALTRAVGRTRTLELLLLNRPVSATEAVQMGLIGRQVPAADLAAAAAELAGRLAAGPTSAFGEIKRLVDVATESSRGDQLTREAAAIAIAATSREGREGVAAFLAKRAPHFTTLASPPADLFHSFVSPDTLGAL